MKKVMLMVAMSILTLTVATVKAEGAKRSTVDMESSFVVEDARANADSVIYKFHIRLKDMNKAMHLDFEQVEKLQYTTVELSRRIARLEKVAPAARKNKLNAILAENLAEVRSFVDDAQFRSYLSLLNYEFNKTGLNGILYGYQLAEM